MIINRLWKMILVTSVLLLAALLLASPRLKVNAEEEGPSMPLKGTPRFHGLTPITPSDELAINQYESDIAIDGNGNAYAVWTDYRNGNADIYFAMRPAGGGWGVNVKVNNDVGVIDQTSPSIAVDASGNAFAVWADSRNGNSDIYFAYRPVGGAWGVNVRVDNASGTSGVSQPDIAVDSSGNAYVVWRDSRNGNDDIYFSSRPAGGAWSANVKVNDDGGTTDQSRPSIAVDGYGNAHAIWEDERSLNTDIYSVYRPAGGNWGINILVNIDADPFDQEYPDIDVDPGGNRYAVWHDNGGIYFSYRSSGGSWGAKLEVSSYADGASSIAVDASGNAYVVWGESWGENSSGIVSAYRLTGGAWSDPTLVDGDPATYKGDPSLAMSTNGQAFVVWDDYRGDNLDIYFAYKPVDYDWGSSSKVNDDDGTPQFSPSLAVSPDGSAYAAWDDDLYGFTGGDIHFTSRQRGGSWEDNVLVNDFPVYAYNPAIAIDGSQNTYAVWEDWRNVDADIYFAYRPAGGDWGPNVRVNDDLGIGDQSHPAIAVDVAGNAYAVWDDSRESTENNFKLDIYFSYRPAGGDWGPNVKVNLEPGSDWQTHPSIAVDSGGNAYAIWDGEDPDGAYFAYRPAGGNWGAHAKVDTVPGSSNRLPDIAVDPDGNAYAIWRGARLDFEEHDIYFAYRPTGGAWGVNVRINDDVGDFEQSYPAITVDTDGNAYAVWEDDRENGPDIYFSYLPAGGAWGENILVNRFPGGRISTAPDIGVDGSGNAYVVWEDWSIATAAIYFAYTIDPDIGVYLPLLIR